VGKLVPMILRLSCLFFVLALVLIGCDAPYRRRQAPAPGKHLTTEAKEAANLTDREYLMRKATVGSRPERIEALDVIDRANDPEMFPFLMERLKKEDDRFIQIRVMQALANTGDIRAVPPLRKIARWDPSRVGIEATAALYELGDDMFVPRLIMKLRQSEESPELAGIAHRTLKRMTGADLPASPRVWLNYHRSHSLTPYQTRAWFWPFKPPLPPHDPDTGKVTARPKGQVPLPDHDLRVRRTNVTWYDWWKPDEP
jgi:hypothetical protein